MADACANLVRGEFKKSSTCRYSFICVRNNKSLQTKNDSELRSVKYIL